MLTTLKDRCFSFSTFQFSFSYYPDSRTGYLSEIHTILHYHAEIDN